MKNMRFLDNVKTPEAWKQEALSRAAEENGRPQLKRWQITGIAAVTAMAVLSIGVIPALYGDRAVDTKIGSENSSKVTSEVTDAEDDILPTIEEEDIIDRQPLIDNLKKNYDYIETFTVLDSQMLDDGTLLLAGAREKYKMGNGMLCIRVPKEHEPYSDIKTEAPAFGDRVCVGFRRVRGEGLVEIPTKLTVNGREYTAKQATDAVYADLYMPLGKTDDSLFGNVLKSACAATGQTADEPGRNTKDLVRCYYSNAERVKPGYDNNCKFISDRLMMTGLNTLFDERYTKDGKPSQLFVTAMVNMGYGEIGAEVTEKDGVYTLKLGKHTGTLDIACSTEVDILNVETVPDRDNPDTAYLLVNLADKAGTGNIRGMVSFDITMEDGASTKSIIETNTTPSVALDDDLDFEDFEINAYRMTSPTVDKTESEEDKYYKFAFVLTPKGGADLSELSYSEDPDLPDRVELDIPGLDKYTVTAQCAREDAELVVTDTEPQANGDYLMEMMLRYEGDEREVLPASFTFGKGEMSEQVEITFSEETVSVRNGEEVKKGVIAEKKKPSEEKKIDMPVTVDNKNFDMDVEPMKMALQHRGSRAYEVSFRLTPKVDIDADKLILRSESVHPERMKIGNMNNEKYAVEVQPAEGSGELAIKSVYPYDDGTVRIDLVFRHECDSGKELPVKFTFGKLTDSDEVADECEIVFGE
ncbi:hypothetical protein [uncultured Ruminococcus sp.]|uniref:hypothetical protein n=1 Tax=uncultured Ruminococcus sp. TaxID=165186 RepID=UPI0025FD6B7D|nr:hypothetical protein [uncultured Ruminococcus sp.]